MSPQDRYEHSHLAWPHQYFQELPGGLLPFGVQDYLPDQEVVLREYEEQERDRQIRKNAGVKSERFYTDSEGGLISELQFDRQGRLTSAEKYRATDWQQPHLREVSQGKYRTWHEEGNVLKSLVEVTYKSNSLAGSPEIEERYEMLFDPQGNLTRSKNETDEKTRVIEYRYREGGRFSHSKRYMVTEDDNVERGVQEQALYDEAGRMVLRLAVGKGRWREIGYSYDEAGRLVHEIEVGSHAQGPKEGYYMPDQSPKPLQSAAFGLVRAGQHWKPKPGTVANSEQFYRYHEGRIAFIDRLEPKTNTYFPRRAYYYDAQGRLLRELYRQKREYLSTVYLHEYDQEGRKLRLLTIDGHLNDQIDWDRAAILPEDIQSLKKERNEYDLSFSYHESGAIQSIRSDERIHTMAPLAKVDQYHPDGRPRHVWTATFKKDSVQAIESFFEYDYRDLLSHVRTRKGKTEDFMRVVREFWD